MTDFRALCFELTEHLALLDEPPAELVVRAQAALAEADGPAVSDDREPASVTDTVTHQLVAIVRSDTDKLLVNITNLTSDVTHNVTSS